MIIRKLEKTDIIKCLEIYKYYIENTVVTFEEQTPTLCEFEQRLTEIANTYPFFVAESNDGILGYAYIDIFNKRSSYRYTADLSIYVDKKFCNNGIGSKLYFELEKAAKEIGIKNIVSLITSQNDSSIRFHEKIGFNFVGELKNVGYKFNEYLSVKYYQKII